jgi:hypothetical protein
MSKSIHGELSALGERWRVRARTFMEEAERSRRSAEVVGLTAMASTLEWAAGDLSFYADSQRSAIPLRSAAPGGDQGSQPNPPNDDDVA